MLDRACHRSDAFGRFRRSSTSMTASGVALLWGRGPVDAGVPPAGVCARARAQSDVVVDLSGLVFADASLMLDLAVLARRLRVRGRACYCAGPSRGSGIDSSPSACIGCRGCCSWVPRRRSLIRIFPLHPPGFFADWSCNRAAAGLRGDACRPSLALLAAARAVRRVRGRPSYRRDLHRAADLAQRAGGHVGGRSRDVPCGSGWPTASPRQAACAGGARRRAGADRRRVVHFPGFISDVFGALLLLPTSRQKCAGCSSATSRAGSSGRWRGSRERTLLRRRVDRDRRRAAATPPMSAAGPPPRTLAFGDLDGAASGRRAGSPTPAARLRRAGQRRGSRHGRGEPGARRRERRVAPARLRRRADRLSRGRGSARPAGQFDAVCRVHGGMTVEAVEHDVTARYDVRAPGRRRPRQVRVDQGCLRMVRRPTVSRWWRCGRGSRAARSPTW